MQDVQTEGLRLLVYDRTCGSGLPPRPGLSHAWASGQVLYRGLGRIDAALGADSWDAGLAWLSTVGGDQPISQIQYWGHGKWGCARLGTQRLDADALGPGHRWARHLDRLRARIPPGNKGLVWFRTCETFGCVPGQTFAQRLAERLGCRVAGHTFIIALWQSGLHTLEPGQRPDWPVHEGLFAGSPSEPRQAYGSRPWRPNTISFLHGSIPAGF